MNVEVNKTLLAFTIAFAVHLMGLRWVLDHTFDLSWFLRLFTILSAIYVAAILWIQKKDFTHPSPVFFLVSTTLLFRFFLVTDDPILSTDVHRYLWDGFMVLQKINPFSYAPSDPHLLHFRVLQSLPPNHAGIPSVYPPFALAYFALGRWIANTPLVFTIGATFIDAATTFILAKTLIAKKLNPLYAIIFAWHPLSILESGHNGHFESVGLLFLAISFYFYEKSPLQCSMSIAFAGLTKTWPILFLGKFFHERGQKRVSFLALGIFGIGMVALLLHGKSIEGYTQYMSRWEFHAATYSVLNGFFQTHVARNISWTCFALAISWIVYAKKNAELHEFCIWISGAFVFFSPTVHPWYTLWLLPPLVFVWDWRWIYLTLATVSSYSVLPRYLTEGVWEEALWPRWLTYGPVFVFLILPKVYPHWNKRSLRKTV